MKKHGTRKKVNAPAMAAAGGKSPAFLKVSDGSVVITKIVGMVPASRMPRSREKIVGIINFRGTTIPVLDLRLHLFEDLQYLSETICVMAGETGDGEEPVLFAALLDSEADAYALLASRTN